MEFVGQNKDQVMKTNWFDRFPIGNDAPGVRHFRDSGEERDGCAAGWKPEDVTYYFNSQHYRGYLEPESSKPAAFGCSFTFGTGVDEKQHWPGLMGIVNCGQPGSSNDKITRLAVTYCKNFKPSSIYVMWTFPQRREWVDEQGNMIAFKNLSELEIKNILSQKFVSWDNTHLFLMNDLWDEYNYTKNKLLLESFCTANNIKLFQTTVTEIDHGNYPKARDNMHPGPEWHINVAASFTD